jgi:predicted transposase/invertase (TIGR01784 family)
MAELLVGRRGLLDPKLDVVFWMLFGAERNRALLLALLNAVLSPPAPIVSVEVQRPELAALDVDGKQVALDLCVRLASGEQIDVEMQTRSHPALRERGLFYWARLYSGQLPRGASYSELRRCVVVLITDFIELPGSPFHTVFQARDRHAGALLTEHFELHFVELPKLSGSDAGSDEPALAGWCRFLSATANEELEALAMQHPILDQAKAALEDLSADPNARLWAERREQALLLHEAGVAKARRESHEQGLAEGRSEGLAEGRSEGLAEGRAQGRSELLLQLLALKFGEQPVAVVDRVRQASEEDLIRWSERFVFSESVDRIFEA